MGYLVDDNNELEMDIDWSKTYGNLTSGKYRIVKKIYDGEYKYFSVDNMILMGDENGYIKS